MMLSQLWFAECENAHPVACTPMHAFANCKYLGIYFNYLACIYFNLLCRQNTINQNVYLYVMYHFSRIFKIETLVDGGVL